MRRIQHVAQNDQTMACLGMQIEAVPCDEVLSPCHKPALHFAFGWSIGSFFRLGMARGHRLSAVSIKR